MLNDYNDNNNGSLGSIREDNDDGEGREKSIQYDRIRNTYLNFTMMLKHS